MTQSSRRFIVLQLSIVFSVLPLCAADTSVDKQLGEIRDNAALVYLIREHHYLGRGRTMFVYADESFLGVLEDNSYTFAFVEPGPRLFWLNWAKVTTEVDLEAGQVYYFNIWHGFDEIDEMTGKALIDVVEFYSTPLEKERNTAAKHIQNRYAKAQASAAKRPEEEFVGTQRKREEHVAKWRPLDLSGYSTLFIEDFEVTDPKAGERKKSHLVELAPMKIANQIVEALGEEVFDAVHRGATETGIPGALVLRGEITQYKPGRASTRSWVGLGTGGAHLDFVARLIDAATGVEVTTFSGKRTWAWGGAMGAVRDIGALEKNAAYEIALYIEQCRTGGDE